MPTITEDNRPYDVLVATNRFLNTNFDGADAPSNELSMTSVGIVSDSGNNVAAGTCSVSTVASMRLQPNASRPAAAPAQVWYAKIDVKNPNAGTRAFEVILRFYNTAGGTLGSITGSFTTAATIAAGATTTVTVSGTAPASTASVGLTVARVAGTGAAVSDLTYADKVLLGLEDVAAFSGNTTDTTAFQYDWTGTTNASTSTKKERNTNTDPVDPTQILSYKATRPIRTLVHDIINREPVEVTLAPAGPRTGQIEYLFASATDLARAENIHKQGVSTITLSGAPYFGTTMKYVPTGELVTELDIDTGYFMLTTGFQEIL